MKINLHCHTNYSDGDNIFSMALEHQKQGFSSFVVTDHVHPSMYKNDSSLFISSYEEFKKQAQELNQISMQLKFSCIQGMELALWGEEILVFGEKISKEIFDFMGNTDLQKLSTQDDRLVFAKKWVMPIIQILKENKKNSAVILCHPHLDPKNNWVLKSLYPVLDGYEFQNHGHYYFTDKTNVNEIRRANRPIPPELQNKNKFYNSDAHRVRSATLGKSNFHDNEIKTLTDLIAYIKKPQKEKQ